MQAALQYLRRYLWTIDQIDANLLTQFGAGFEYEKGGPAQFFTRTLTYEKKTTYMKDSDLCENKELRLVTSKEMQSLASDA